MSPVGLLAVHRITRLKRRLTLVGASLILLLTPRQASAQGNLLVTPRRILFENTTRVQELNLANIGTDTARYLVSLMEIRMKEDGSFEQIKLPDTGQLFASRYLRIYPRNVIVAPGESQLVKVQFVKPEGLTPGEYRSHIYIRAVPVEKPLGDKETKRDTTDISVKLTAIFGISIPALVRVGENDTRITLSDPSFAVANGKTPRLKVSLNRSGKMSSYGDITVDRIAADGKVSEVGVVRGIAVYTPNNRRRFQLDLNAQPTADFHNCKLHIVYKPQKNSGNQEIAEAELTLP